jgi:hypothetical protein
VIKIARLLQIIVGITGLCALVLGLFIWIANIDLTDIHMLFGLLVTLGLLVMSIIALTAPGLRIWGSVGIVYAIILLLFGVSQSSILVGNLHWLIQTLHTLIGIGAIVLTVTLGVRYRTLKRGKASPAASSQALRQGVSVFAKGRHTPHAARYTYVQHAKHREARKERRCNIFW